MVTQPTGTTMWHLTRTQDWPIHSTSLSGSRRARRYPISCNQTQHHTQKASRQARSSRQAVCRRRRGHLRGTGVCSLPRPASPGAERGADNKQAGRQGADTDFAAAPPLSASALIDRTERATQPASESSNDVRNEAEREEAMPTSDANYLAAGAPQPRYCRCPCSEAVATFSYAPCFQDALARALATEGDGIHGQKRSEGKRRSRVRTRSWACKVASKAERGDQTIRTASGRPGHCDRLRESGRRQLRSSSLSGTSGRATPRAPAPNLMNATVNGSEPFEWVKSSPPPPCSPSPTLVQAEAPTTTSSNASVWAEATTNASDASREVLTELRNGSLGSQQSRVAAIDRLWHLLRPEAGVDLASEAVHWFSSGSTARDTAVAGSSKEPATGMSAAELPAQQLQRQRREEEHDRAMVSARGMAPRPT